ncbi:unnamed protein product [Prunus brigantina]
MWFGVIGKGNKSFNNHKCWEVVKNCSRFKIISTKPSVVLNETPLHNSPASNYCWTPRLIKTHQTKGSQGLLVERLQRPREEHFEQ